MLTLKIVRIISIIWSVWFTNTFLQHVIPVLNPLLHLFSPLTSAPCENRFHFKTNHKNFLVHVLHRAPERSLNTTSNIYVIRDIRCTNLIIHYCRSLLVLEWEQLIIISTFLQVSLLHHFNSTHRPSSAASWGTLWIVFVCISLYQSMEN